MASKKPTQPPAFDAATFVKALADNIKKPDGSSYSVFTNGYFERLMRWFKSEGEFDGGGLRDVVNADAYYLDSVKNNLDSFEGNINPRMSDLEARVAALESQPSVPFPGSG